jgi:hypothetical protein
VNPQRPEKPSVFKETFLTLENHISHQGPEFKPQFASQRKKKKQRKEQMLVRMLGNAKMLLGI